MGVYKWKYGTNHCNLGSHSTDTVGAPWGRTASKTWQKDEGKNSIHFSVSDFSPLPLPTPEKLKQWKDNNMIPRIAGTVRILWRSLRRTLDFLEQERPVSMHVVPHALFHPTPILIWKQWGGKGHKIIYSGQEKRIQNCIFSSEVTVLSQAKFGLLFWSRCFATFIERQQILGEAMTGLLSLPTRCQHEVVYTVGR